jgi:outer membrane lipoprotein-sorting protein
MQRASAPKAFAGVITENANLGLPSLPDIGGLSSATLSAADWVSGTHTVEVWYGGPAHVRVAVPVSFGETDLRVDGTEVWLWNSRTQTATRYLPPKPVKAPAPGRARQRGPNVGRGGVPFTPEQVATKILAAVGPTTKVSVTSNAVVAGRPAYQLVVAPRTDESLIGRVVIAVDSATYLPLEVQVFARGAASPAFSVGFTSLSFSQPAASNFSFTPPAGAHVKTVQLPRPGTGLASTAPLRAGPNIAVLPGTSRVKTITISKKARVTIRFRVSFPAWRPNQAVAVLPVTTNLGSTGGGVFASSGAKVVGRGWLSVLVVPAGLPSTSAVISSYYDPAMPAEARTEPDGATSAGHNPMRQAIIGLGTPGAAPAQVAALLRVLMNAAAPVHGSWGSGRLLRTSLFSVLFTNQGSTLIGAVTPAVLFADAAKAK